jgi:putative membrane protein
VTSSPSEQRATGTVAVTDSAGWHRLHPLSPLVRAGRQMMTLVIVLVTIALANQRQERGDLIADIAVVVVVLGGGVVSWLVTRWQVAGGVLRIETGLLRRDSRRFPLSQVQAIDVVQTGLARVLGLAELRLRVAGGDTSRGGRLACMPVADAERLRTELLAKAAALRAPGSTQPGPAQPGPAQPGPAQPGPLLTVPANPDLAQSRWFSAAPAAAVTPRELFRVRSSRLAVAIMLSRSGAIAVVVIAVMVVIAVVARLTGVATSLAPIALGAVLGTWRQFNGEYGTAVTTAADGLRLRSGLIQTSAETIRPGRVQGVRLAEPLAWRAFGWCRLEADIAGPSQRREDRSEGQRLRVLVPVGSRAEAEEMLAELLGQREFLRPSRRPPRRARWKAPLSFHFLAWGGDDRYVVASRGRLRRVTTWVPLEKVQSIRWVQGPVQRRFALASVRLDVAGRHVAADIQDRDAAEAADTFARLPDLARVARADSTA